MDSTRGLLTGLCVVCASDVERSLLVLGLRLASMSEDLLKSLDISGSGFDFELFTSGNWCGVDNSPWLSAFRSQTILDMSWVSGASMYGSLYLPCDTWLRGSITSCEAAFVL